MTAPNSSNGSSGNGSSGNGSSGNGSSGNGSSGNGSSAPKDVIDNEQSRLKDVSDLAPDTPPEVLELAAVCVRYVGAAVKLQPDFTPETMSLLDHYVRVSRETIKEKPAVLGLTARAIGAYLGELIRRQYHCWWRLNDADDSAWRIEFRDVHLMFYPVQVAYTVLTKDHNEEQFTGFELSEENRNAVTARLAELPPVSEDEYYLPSTRLEVLDITVDALATESLREPSLKRTFRPEDYE